MRTDYFLNMLPEEERPLCQLYTTFNPFLERIAQYGDKVAINHRGVETTYSQFVENIAKRRQFILSLGLEKGSHIAIFDRNSQDSLELQLAILTSGYVLMNLPAQLAGQALWGTVKKFAIKAMFVRDEFVPVCEEAKVDCPTYPSSSIADSAAPAVDLDPDALAAIFFTGGSTGVPKGAMLSQRNLQRGIYNGIFRPDSVFNKQHRVIAFLPFSHIFGFIAGSMSVFYTGGTLFTCEDMKAGIGSLPKIRPTHLVLVPGIIEILAGLAKMYGPQFFGGEFKTIACGAACVPAKLITMMKELGVTCFQGYGLTESTNLTSGNAESIDNPTSVGKFYDEADYKIVDGELLLKGDNIFQGYWGDPVQTSEAFTEDGWFHTGDLVRLDKNGYLYIVGRIKNIIVLANGENVSPESLEEPFYARPYIKDCLVKEVEMNGTNVLGIQILPNMQALEGKTPEEIHALMQQTVDEINAQNPTQWHIRNLVIRTEDFVRTGALKIARNKN